MLYLFHSRSYEIRTHHFCIMMVKNFDKISYKTFLNMFYYIWLYLAIFHYLSLPLATPHCPCCHPSHYPWLSLTTPHYPSLYLVTLGYPLLPFTTPPYPSLPQKTRKNFTETNIFIKIPIVFRD